MRAASMIRALIRDQLTRRGRTALCATHDLSDVAELCDRVIVLEAGIVQAEGKPSEAARLVGVGAASEAAS